MSRTIRVRPWSPTPAITFAIAELVTVVPFPCAFIDWLTAFLTLGLWLIGRFLHLKTLSSLMLAYTERESQPSDSWHLLSTS